MALTYQESKTPKRYTVAKEHLPKADLPARVRVLGGPQYDRRNDQVSLDEVEKILI